MGLNENFPFNPSMVEAARSRTGVRLGARLICALGWRAGWVQAAIALILQNWSIFTTVIIAPPIQEARIGSRSGPGSGLAGTVTVC